MEQLRGKLRQKEKNGPYYYRLTVANGLRKEFSLKTCDYDEACQKAADLDALWEAPTKEVAFAQINAIKGFSRRAMNLPLSEGWRKYEVHPDRATPHTVSEQLAYQSWWTPHKTKTLSLTSKIRCNHPVSGNLTKSYYNC